MRPLALFEVARLEALFYTMPPHVVVLERAPFPRDSYFR